MRSWTQLASSLIPPHGRRACSHSRRIGLFVVRPSLFPLFVPRENLYGTQTAWAVPEYPSPISPRRCRMRAHNRITTCNAGVDRPDSDQRDLSETITVSSVSADKSPPLNIRIKGPQRTLIERAAKQADKSISDFVRDAALQEAQNSLLDTTRIELDPASWEQFIAVLDAPPAENPRLRDLMSRKAPWER